MSRSLRVRQPRTADIRRLHEIFESALEPGQRRRAQAILLYAAGLSAVEIARLLEVHAHTIYADLHAFDIYGVTAVYRLGQGGAPSRLPLPNSPKWGGWLNYRLMSWASLTGDGHCRNCDPL